MQKQKSVLQKIKNFTKGRFGKTWGFVSGFSLGLFVWALSATITLIVAGGCWPAVVMGVTALALGAAHAGCYKKSSDDSFLIGMAGYTLGMVMPGVAFCVYLDCQKNNAENIFKSERQAVTQTFNQNAFSIKDGWRHVQCDSALSDKENGLKPISSHQCRKNRAAI